MSVSEAPQPKENQMAINEDLLDQLMTCHQKPEDLIGDITSIQMELSSTLYFFLSFCSQ